MRNECDKLDELYGKRQHTVQRIVWFALGNCHSGRQGLLYRSDVFCFQLSTGGTKISFPTFVLVLHAHHG